MSSEAVDLLREIRDELREIRLILAAPRGTRKRHGKRAKLDATLAQQGRADCANPDQIVAVVALWRELCPACAPVVLLNDDRKLKIASLWQQMGGEEGIRNVFLTVAGNDWLCGRVIFRGSARAPVGLFEVIENLPEVLEGTFK